MQGDPSSHPVYTFPPPRDTRATLPPINPHSHASSSANGTRRLKLNGPDYFRIILNDPVPEPPRPSTSQLPSQEQRWRTLDETDYRNLQYNHATNYLRQQLCLLPNVQVNLWAIADPVDGAKPYASLPTLIKLAIHGSPQRRLTLQGICDALIGRFTWFRNHQQDDAWKNSVRHNLSLNKVFRKVPRDMKQIGKGCYWELDLSGGEGHKRPRKRRKPGAHLNSTPEAAPSHDTDEVESVASTEGTPRDTSFDEAEPSSMALSSPYSPPPSNRSASRGSYRSPDRQR
ncbi:unnamed protein product [Mycena citricolor]|uniref:Fork-head domain-containing protein n=1 Tax=Mycena citricolor TaxID=2018698 RepID=A0AAD2JZN8_9AGAR|nr:unnamed protein product [Mycena citricolor]